MLTPSQIDARMRHASLALLGSAVQLDYLGDLFVPTGRDNGLSAAASYGALTVMTRRTLVHAEAHRQAWCEFNGLEFVAIEPTEVPDPI